MLLRHGWPVASPSAHGNCAGRSGRFGKFFWGYCFVCWGPFYGCKPRNVGGEYFQFCLLLYCHFFTFLFRSFCSFATFSFLGFSVFLPISLFLSSSVSSFDFCIFLGPRACGVIFCLVYVISHPSFFPAMHFVIIFITCRNLAFCAAPHCICRFACFCHLHAAISFGFVYANFRSARSLCYWCFCICLFFCFAYCSCHRGFADAYGFVFHAALAVGALQMLIDLFCMLLLPSGLCRCLLICFACCSCRRGFADAYWFVLHAALAVEALQMLIVLFYMLLLPSEVCRCLLICVACCFCHLGFAMLIDLFACCHQSFADVFFKTSFLYFILAT